jgi:MFS family permease
VLRGRTALETGLLLLPMAISSGIATPLAGRLYDRIGPRALVVFGYVVLAYNTWELAHLTAATSIRFIAFLMLLRGLALGTTVQSTFTTALGAVPIRRVARGSSLVNATRNVIQAIGVAVLATLLAGPLSPEVRAADRARQLEAAGEPPGLCVPGGPSAPAGAGGAVPSGEVSAASAPTSAPEGRTAKAPASPGAPSASSRMPEGAAACAEHLAGFSDAYMLTFVMSLVALLLGLTLPGWPGPWSGRTGLAAEDD